MAKRFVERQEHAPALNNTLLEQRVILFDGVCRLCHGWSRFIMRYDRQRCFKLCSVQSAIGRQILRVYDYPEHTFETMLFIDQGVCYQKSEAFLRVVSYLGWPWKGLHVFKVIPLGIRDWLYDRIALNRYTLFGKYDQCLLPTPDHKARFLDEV